MQNFKTGKWANKIIACQKRDGSWGNFHSLSSKAAEPYTTEYALHRLEILGFTIEDACIQQAVSYMNDCLVGKTNIPDRSEKSCDWKVFYDLMLSTWIRRFTDNNEPANRIASSWSNIIQNAFSDGEYSHQKYSDAYIATFGNKPYGGRLTDFVSFYQISLLRDQLNEPLENAMFDYVLHHKSGIYYTYENSIAILPKHFQHKQTSRYLGAIELLSGYRRNQHKLHFATEWLSNQRLNNGKWDMGIVSKDGLYFPLSDRWDTETRMNDCTLRIERILNKIQPF